MFDTALQLAKREWRGLIFTPRFWALLLCVSLVLGLMGPFGTYDELRLAARLGYWAVMAVASYLVGAVSVAFLTGFVAPARRASLAANAICGALAGVPVALVVWTVNAVTRSFESPIGFLPLLGYCVVIAALVSPVVAMLSVEPATDAEQSLARVGETSAAQRERSQIARPRILDRLPLQARGNLSHITVQDHYVDIRTDRGGALVLMRLADAIAETEGVDGLQIHRSHWVAKAAVKNIVRRDGKVELELINGVRLPVSRSYLAAVKSAGVA